MKKSFILPLFLFIIILFSDNLSYSQIGGDNTYEFLNMPNSARIAALGSNFLAIKDNDITLALANPSIITPDMHNQLALSFVDYFTDINYGFVSYSRTFSKIGSFVGTMQFIDYGKFTLADETGQKYGNFQASEYALNVGWGRELDSAFSIGANFKMIYSALESYTSFGIAVDVAGSYHIAKKQFTISFIARNIGLQLKSYRNGNSEPLPFELQLGLSKRLKHLPFRYSILITHLEKWDLTYDDQNNPSEGTDPITGEPNKKSGFADFGDKLMRHIVIGGEVLITKNFSVRLGYNYQRRQELKVDSKLSTVGFSWGLGLRISKFHFSYSRSAYHLVGSPNYITITTCLSDFVSRK